jgi:hypothetical protein
MDYSKFERLAREEEEAERARKQSESEARRQRYLAEQEERRRKWAAEHPEQAAHQHAGGG